MNDHDIMYVLSPLVLLHQNVFFFLAVQEKIVYLYCYKENERNVTFATTYIVLLLRHVVLYPPAACVCVSSWPSRPSWPSHVCPIYPIYNDMIRYDMICKTLFFFFLASFPTNLVFLPLSHHASCIIQMQYNTPCPRGTYREGGTAV